MAPNTHHLGETGYHEFRGRQTAAMRRRCNNRPVWAVLSLFRNGSVEKVISAGNVTDGFEDWDLVNDLGNQHPPCLNIYR